MKTAVLMVGLPACGKSTLRNNILAHHAKVAINPVPAWSAISTDDLIDQFAQSRNETYTEVFSSYIKTAEAKARAKLKVAVGFQDVIFVDRTHMSLKSRKIVIDQIKAIDPEYHFLCFNVFCDAKTWEERLKQRPDKVIPESVLTSMKARFQAPHPCEGFDAIVHINTTDGNDAKVYYEEVLNSVNK